MDKERSGRQESQRQQDFEALLAEAQARPGVREAMQAYQNWQKSDRVLDTYRRATNLVPQPTTTDHANVR